jgi:hypothetical protein
MDCKNCAARRARRRADPHTHGGRRGGRVPKGTPAPAPRSSQRR